MLSFAWSLLCIPAVLPVRCWSSPRATVFTGPGSPLPALRTVKTPVPAAAAHPWAANLGIEQAPIPILIGAMVSSIFKHRESDRCRCAFAVRSFTCLPPRRGAP